MHTLKKEKARYSTWRYTPLATLLCMLFPQLGYAEEFFNPNALQIDNADYHPVDLSQFSTVGNQLPGTYRVDVYLNGAPRDTLDITFVKGAHGALQPALTSAQLKQWGVATSVALNALRDDEIITDLPRLIPQASAQFDFSRLRLNISIPQVAMKSSAQGSVDPKYWDQGMPALLMDYRFTGSNTRMEQGGGTSDSYFTNLRSGINIGGWRLRNYSTWNYNKSQSSGTEVTRSTWNSINTYVQRDIPAINGRFTAGDSYTPSDVFDSVQFKGAQVASDDNMLPDSLRGFAPTIRGIASSNAQVTIKQNGSVLYQTYVTPGAFVIDDLYPTSLGGDLEVTIKEADGSTRSFIQPFSSVPIMQREGRLKYAVTAGQYRAPDNDDDEPIMGQATLLYGLSHRVTLYGGLQAADNYTAFALGSGFGLNSLGSVSLDVTQAYTSLRKPNESGRQSKEGQSIRFQYSKDIEATDSTVTLAGYRYSTKGFYSFSEAMDYHDEDDDNYLKNKRSRVQLNFTQNLKSWGSLSFTGYQQDYWSDDGHERNISVGYSNSWNSVNWTLMYTWSTTTGSDANDNRMLSLNVSVPLSHWLPGSYVSANTNNDLHGRSNNQLTLSGTALEANNFSYSVGQGYGNRGQQNSGTATATYRGTYGAVNGGYNYDHDSRQVNYGAQGSLLLHADGLTLGQSLSGDMSSVALVRARDAEGVNIQNGTGIRTDWRGYAIVPYLSSYKRSRIAMDSSSLGDDVELKQNVVSVVPTAGAVVLAEFKTRVGGRVLMTLLHGGKAVPFGATVTIDGTDDNTGIVGDAGQVYLSGVPEVGALTAKWGTAVDQQCHAEFTLPKKDEQQSNITYLPQLNLNCVEK